jgi:hypothetical protein
MVVHVGSLTPLQALGIPVALIGSVLLALGAEFQHRGVRRSARPDGTSRFARVLALVRERTWLLGTLLLAAAIPFQLLSLFLAPLTVVQPLGAAALVVSALLNARAAPGRTDGRLVRAVALCVLGVGLFVAVAAVTTTSRWCWRCWRPSSRWPGVGCRRSRSSRERGCCSGSSAP